MSDDRPLKPAQQEASKLTRQGDAGQPIASGQVRNGRSGSDPHFDSRLFDPDPPAKRYVPPSLLPRPLEPQNLDPIPIRLAPEIDPRRQTTRKIRVLRRVWERHKGLAVMLVGGFLFGAALGSILWRQLWRDPSARVVPSAAADHGATLPPTPHSSNRAPADSSPPRAVDTSSAPVPSSPAPP